MQPSLRAFTLFVTGITVVALFLMPLATPGLKAQTSNESQPFFTIELQGAYASGFSGSMRGTNAEFVREVQAGADYAKYPFGDPSTFGLQFGLEAAYRFRNSQFGLYSALHATGFESLDKPTDSQFGDTAFLAMVTLGIGGEYYYDITSSVDFRGRLGVNFSRIGGNVDIGGSQITAPNTSRLGFEIGANLDWKPVSFLVFTLQAGYTNANLIGKSYTAPTDIGLFLGNHELNDGANPSNPSDNPKTIDFLTLGVAGGVVF